MDETRQENVTPSPNGQKSWGPAIGLIIILILIIAGSLYFFSQEKGDLTPSEEAEIHEQSESDRMEDIESDLEAIETDLEGLDAEMEVIAEEQVQIESEI